MPTNLIQCPDSDTVQLAVCAQAYGWPSGPTTTSGTADPENNVFGYWPGDLYMRTSTSKLYAFNGTAGTAVGWNILN